MLTRLRPAAVVLNLLLAALLPNQAAAQDAAPPAWLATARQGMVSSDSAAASQVGANVLRAGGNAFDAAVATSFALGVTRPYSTGLGGGGFLVARQADGTVIVLDFREAAPPGATPERYAELFEAQADGPSPSVIGPHAVGVPGLLKGLHHIATEHGTLEWPRLIEPAVELAVTGFEVDENFRWAAGKLVERRNRYPAAVANATRLLAETVLVDNEAPETGTTLKNLPLARTLRLIASEGPDVFYTGRIAAAIERATGGVIPRAALAAYEVKRRTPIRVRYQGYEIISMPPPSSGGICLAQTLNIMQAFRAAEPRSLDPVDHMHLRIEAMKHAFADRARWLGDADFAPVPVDYLTSDAYARQLAQQITLTSTATPADYGRQQLPDDRGTSHFCVADAAGNVVAITETINATWGSHVVVEPFGIILNNELDDFLTVRGQPNLYGLVQGEANLIAPGKRPLSSMSPTIVLRDDQPVLALGASGGPRIISSVLNVMLNVIDVGQPLAPAIASVRVHHQWQPDEVVFDRDPSDAGAAALRARGHRLADARRSGIVQAIRFRPDGTLVGASDPRKGGRPAGVD